MPSIQSGAAGVRVRGCRVWALSCSRRSSPEHFNTWQCLCLNLSLRWFLLLLPMPVCVPCQSPALKQRLTSSQALQMRLTQQICRNCSAHPHERTGRFILLPNPVSHCPQLSTQLTSTVWIKKPLSWVSSHHLQPQCSNVSCEGGFATPDQGRSLLLAARYAPCQYSFWEGKTGLAV